MCVININSTRRPDPEEQEEEEDKVVASETGQRHDSAYFVDIGTSFGIFYGF